MASTVLLFVFRMVTLPVTKTEVIYVSQTTAVKIVVDSALLTEIINAATEQKYANRIITEAIAVFNVFQTKTKFVIKMVS
jgi:hypothetical protein